MNRPIPAVPGPRRKRPAPEREPDFTDMKKNPRGWRPPPAVADVTATRQGSPERGDIDLRSVQNVVDDPANRANGNFAETYGASRRPGEEDAARAPGGLSHNGLRGERLNNEGEPDIREIETVRGNRQDRARTSVSPRVPPVPARNRGVEDAINEGARDIANQIANRNARVKKGRRRPD